MVVISYGTIKTFIGKHPEASDAMNNWYRLAQKADWSNFHQLKTMFNSADAVGNDRYIFDVGGNKYRIVAMTFFKVRTIYIRFVGNHSDYDKLKNLTSI